MNKRLASYIKKAFFLTITLVSLSTSFLYFQTVFSLGDGSQMAALATGVFGVLVTDLAAIAWLTIFLAGSDNNDERAFAFVGAIIGGLGSIICSFAYLMSTTPLVTLSVELQSWSIIAMACIVIAHFVFVMLSQYRSTSAQIDDKMAELISEGNTEMMKLTEQAFREQLPALAQQNANELTRQMAGQFASLTANAQSAAAPARLNGSHPNA